VDDLYFRVLGPVSVERDGEPVALGSPQRRLILAVLLSRVNEVVPVEVLVKALWDDSPPPSHRVLLQGRISDLRLRLGSGRGRPGAPIETHELGYLVRVAPDRYDLVRFESDVEQARRAAAAGGTATAADLYRSALRRWRGRAFADVSSPELDRHAAAAEALRATAAEEYADARLADGALAGLAEELMLLAAELPLRERLHGQLMTLYARTGRPGDALRVYRELRDRMVADVGTEPSSEVQRLHREILGAGPEVPGPPAAAPPARAFASARRQLPPDVPHFTGRRAELAALMAAGTGAAATVRVIAGGPGVGKTRLAVHAAHLLTASGRFGDGQLYADLGNGAEPAAVLGDLLRLLGVPADQIPAGPASRAAAFRERLADQHILLVLDGAADEAQVAPLLPAGPAAMVIVTARRPLELPGAGVVRLDALTGDDAVDLLAAALGADRVTAEPDAARELVRRCGYRPGPIVAAAQRLRSRPAWPVGYLVERLGREE
jgi:DNA-binding SARP family transcriptional activator